MDWTFQAQELSLIRAVAPSLAEGARRALLVGEAVDPEGPEAPGLIVLSQDGEVESATPGVERWLQELPDGDWDADKLPSAVLAVAGRALRTAEHPTSPARLRSRGCWHARAPGSCSTAPPWSPGAAAAWR
jgi:hypothetical protein